MEQLPAAATTWLLNQGVLGFTTLVGFGLYLWERYARQKDRAVFDAALREAQQEQISILKTILPLAEKFTTTMDFIGPLVMRRVDRGE